ncbi:YSC84-related protein [Teredinibacter franksiae]|uniref:YSC84-related protein n=1 Tax=Teredinibacter franksiae TaxID=2761453 RepID=UPI00162320A0|nr:YSC84-related protein [Teredinibacter franksiae]
MTTLLRIIACTLLLTPLTNLYADDAKYSATMAEFKKNPVVQKFLGKAYGYAVFPNIGKGGLGIGGAHGKGKVYQGGNVAGTTKMTQLTIGLQAGGQAYSQLVLFENKASYDKFTQGEYEFGAQATAVAIKASANATAGTTGNAAGATSKGESGAQNAQYVNGMVVFTYAKGGLMYEASLGGQKYKFEALNKKKEK